MSKRILLLILWQWMLLSSVAWAQKTASESRIVDECTGEPIPYASIYVGPNRGTLANDLGHFVPPADPGTNITISCVGYEPLKTPIKHGINDYRLKPLTHKLNEVVVTAPIPILRHVAKKLSREYRSKGDKKANFFYRSTNTFEGKNEMTEAFLRGKSAINLRHPAFYNGRRVRQNRYSRTPSKIDHTNLQHLVDIGPMTLDVPFWAQTVMPMYIKDKVSWESRLIKDASQYEESNRYAITTFAYDLRATRTTTPQGKAYYCIDISCKERLMYPALEGKLYVDATDYRLLGFEGKLRNMLLDVGVDFHQQSHNAVPTVRILYTHRRGFTEVESLVAHMEVGSLKNRSVLYNLHDLPLPFSTSCAIENDLIKAIEQAGYNPTLWQNETIHRTTEEQQLAWFAQLDEKEQQEWILTQMDTAFSQSGKFRPLVNRMNKFAQVIPQEKVYLHLDNTAYMLGDTIWFKAYTRQTNTDTPSKVSGVLYAELWNHEGYLMERKQIEMKDGSGHGFFALNKDMLYAGFYELRAYTRWQLNWGVHQHPHSRVAGQWFPNKEFEERFYRDYDKIYSRTFPVYDAPLTPHSFDHTMTLRTPRRSFKKNPDKRSLKLSLFPEGGNLIQGVPCRVAFEAAWDDGQWVEGWLYADQDSFPAVNRGRGVFVFTPGSKLPRITFRTTKGESVTARLPQVKDRGVSLQVMRYGNEWHILTHTAGNIHPADLALSVTHQGHVERLHHSIGTPLVIPVDSLRDGVHQATVFDAQGQILSDRLFFSYKTSRLLPTVQVNGLKRQYQPYEPIALHISVPSDAPDVSLAVRDASGCDLTFDNGNMLTEMLLASEIKGFVPNPGWFFEADDEEHRQALDLLMMTQGWRRFEWRSMALHGTWDLTQPDERAPIIMGKVYPYETFNHNYVPGETGSPDNLMQHTPIQLKQDVKVHAELVTLLNNGLNDTLQLEDIYVQEKQTKNGAFRLQLPRTYERSVLYIDASDTTKWKRRKKYTWVQQSDDWEDWPDIVKRRKFVVQPPEFYVVVDFPYPRFVKPYTFHQTHLMHAPRKDNGTFHLLSDGTTEMTPVMVQSKRNIMRGFSDKYPVFMMDAYEAYNMAYDAGISFARTQVGDYGLDFPYLRYTTHMDPGVGGKITEFSGWTDRINYRYSWQDWERTNKGLTTHPDSTLMRMQLRSHHGSHLLNLSQQEALRYLSISRSDKVIFYSDYAPRMEGSKRYRGSNLPETNVVLTHLPEDSRRVIYRNRRFVLEGFSACADFYHPDYSKRKPDAKNADYRRTLYWNPYLKFDDKGRAQVKFFNNARTTRIIVDAEGQTQSGKLIWSPAPRP